MKYPLAGLAMASLLLISPWAGAASKDGAADTLAPMLDSLAIGSPLPALPDCADKRSADGRDVTALCVELRGDGVMRQVGVPRDKRPAFMDGPHVVAFVDGNALVGLIVPTDGVRSENDAVESLTARFGKAYRSEQLSIKDKAGKVVKSVHAGWMKKPLTVELYAIPEDPNTGTIEMLLPQARLLMANQDAAMAQQLNPTPASEAQAASKAGAKKGKDGKW
ncbi:hypothetical protein P3W85_00215 [Cupriavidus basilensis]|uniref:Uncharacterized protein n=1 Tax=Cupriavidus basilensis TaxID=68895 RepID=A0ABT6AFK4_9BURK|nr:hypothetical protein [Cupriavidus basilensis]MDF3831392.1 hypothetical protein [Cupriavidus basilensis]